MTDFVLWRTDITAKGTYKYNDKLFLEAYSTIWLEFYMRYSYVDDEEY